MTGSDKGMEMVEVILNLKNNPGGWFRIFTPFFCLSHLRFCYLKSKSKGDKYNFLNLRRATCNCVKL